MHGSRAAFQLYKLNEGGTAAAAAGVAAAAVAVASEYKCPIKGCRRSLFQGYAHKMKVSN